MKRDTLIFDFIKKERERQMEGIELIASENFVSEQVLEAMGSVMTNKYAEGYPRKRYYGGCQFVDESEQLAIDRLKELFGVEYVNVQPHSGAQANMAVFLACLKPGDTFMGLDLAHGGHLSHGSPVNSSGILYRVIPYTVDKETGTVNYDTMREIALKERPKLILAGASAYSRDWDYKKMRKITDEIGAILMADIAHPAGLIAKKLLNDPFEHCHVVTSTTHKTLRGPRGGIIMIGKDYPNPFGATTPKGEIKTMGQVIDSAVFPGIQGGPLQHVIASKAVAFGEALTDEYLTYIVQVKKNANLMAKKFVNRGYKVISDGTDSHLMLIDLRTKFPEITGRKAEDALGLADITVNKNMVPFDHRSPFYASGIRVGTPAITTRGMKESHAEIIVDFIDNIISNIGDENNTIKVKKEVNEFTEQFPLFAW